MTFYHSVYLFRLSKPSGCYEVTSDGVCLLENEPTVEDYNKLAELEDNADETDSEDRLSLIHDVVCPPGFRKDAKSICRKVK
jgi:hypothetical protein